MATRQQIPGNCGKHDTRTHTLGNSWYLCPLGFWTHFINIARYANTTKLPLLKWKNQCFVHCSWVNASYLFGGKNLPFYITPRYKGTKTMSIRPQELLKQTKTKPTWHFAELTHTQSPIIIHHELGCSIILSFERKWLGGGLGWFHFMWSTNFKLPFKVKKLW